MKASRLSKGAKVVLGVIPATMLALTLAVGAEEQTANETQTPAKAAAMGPQFDKITASVDAVKQSLSTAMNVMSNFNASTESKKQLLDNQIAALSEVAAMCEENGPVGKELAKTLQKTDDAISRVKPLAENSALDPKLLEGYRKVIASYSKDRERLAKNAGSLATQRATLLKNISILKDQKDYYVVVIEAGQLTLVNEAVSSLVEQMCALNKNLDSVTDMFKPATETVPPKQ